MSRYFLLTISALLISCVTNKPYFIPKSPLSSKEKNDLYKKLINQSDVSEKYVKEYINEYHKFKYRDQAIRLAFPMLKTTDKQVSFCSNSALVGQPYRVTFVSIPKQKKVTLKTSNCVQIGSGLQCKPLEFTELYFYKIPENHFAIGTGTTYEEAIKVLSLFEKNEIKDIPAWFKGVKVSDIYKVSKTTEGFQLSFGGVNCSHCAGKIHVKNKNNYLELIEAPEAVCV